MKGVSAPQGGHISEQTTCVTALCLCRNGFGEERIQGHLLMDEMHSCPIF